MATKTLGIDLGTNSIGWAIVENQESSKRLLDRGVNIFQVGMKVEKNVESPTVSKRTEARASRRKIFQTALPQNQASRDSCGAENVSSSL